jgi:RNA polymerase sigma factor (sigma-70 family)
VKYGLRANGAGRSDSRPRSALAGLAGLELLAEASDEQLVALAADGDENAFAAIVARYRGGLEHQCRRTLPPSRAEDALQQTFTNAYVALRSGRTPVALRPWLFTIAHNAALDGLRERQGEALDSVTYVATANPTSDIVSQREALRAVLRALTALPSRQRDVIFRQEFAGRSHAQIADELGLTRGAVRQLAHRARISVRSAAAALAPAPLWLRMHRVPRLPRLPHHMLSFLDPTVGGHTAMLAKTAVVVTLVTLTGGAEVPHVVKTGPGHSTAQALTGQPRTQEQQRAHPLHRATIGDGHGDGARSATARHLRQ